MPKLAPVAGRLTERRLMRLTPIKTLAARWIGGGTEGEVGIGKAN